MNPLILKSIGFAFNLTSYILPNFAGKKSFQLFSTPFVPKMRQEQKSWLSDHLGGSINHDGDEMKYYKWGNGNYKILILHGWQSHTFRWKKLIEKIPKDTYTIYAIDGPAHGLSEGTIMNMPLYSSVVNQFYLTIDQPKIIIGHSLGGMTAIFSTVTHESINPEALILLGTPGNVRDFLDYFKNYLGLNERMYQLFNKEFIKKFDQSPEDFKMKDYVNKLSIPGLIIHDTDDVDVDVKHANDIHQNWPASELIITQGLGHKLRSDEVNKIVNKFIEKIAVNYCSIKS